MGRVGINIVTKLAGLIEEDNMTQTILITGANRGLGLEFTTQYAKDGWQVLACCKDPSQANDLQALQKQFPQIEIHSLDVTDESQIKSLQQEIKQPIDILLNNAGFLEVDSFGSVSSEVMTKTFLINTVAPLKMAEAFADHVANSEKKLIANITSSMGSISDNQSGGYYSYRTSKAALNMVMKSAGYDLASKQIKVLLLHPGWVKTRMGGDDAAITAKDSVSGMRKVIADYSPKSGEVKFIRYNGEIVAW